MEPWFSNRGGREPAPAGVSVVAFPEGDRTPSPGRPAVRKYLLLAIMPFLFATTEAPFTGRPPGVPERCCGYLDCRRADVRILRRNSTHDVVSVDGRRLVLPAGTAHRSKQTGSWWCFRAAQDGCHREVSERCARCAVEGRQEMGEMRIIPQPLGAKGSHLLLPTEGCDECHSARSAG